MDTFYSIFQIIAHKCSHWQLANLAGENIPTLKKGHNTKQKDVLFSLGLTAVSYTRYWKQGRLWYSRFCSMKDNLDTYIRLERHWHIAMLYFSVDSPVGQLTTMAQIQIIEGQKILWINQVFVNPQEDFECQANHSWVFQATCFWKLTSCSVGEPDWC